MFKGLLKLLRLFAVNRAVLFGVMSKVWFGIGGFVTFLLIATRFSPVLQGYYFTFYSLLSLQLFIEMGLSTVIINYASHEWSDLTMDAKGGISGEKRSHSRLASLAKQSLKWYAVGGLVMTLLLLVVGFIFFSRSGHDGISWQAPWVCLCVFFGMNFAVLPAFSLLEGCNQVTHVYLYRLIQEIIKSVSTWVVILWGFGLWAPAFSTLAMLVWGVIFLFARYRGFFASLIFYAVDSAISWGREVWPMQWRIAVSWISGYFTFWLFTPVLFYFQGPVVAGRMGMTWTMINALLMISSMWVVTRAPQFGIYVAKKQYKELDKLLVHSSVVAVLMACLGALAIFSVVFGLNFFGHPFAARFLDPASTIYLLIAAVIMQVTTTEGLYLRAHKQEPLMVVSAIAAVIMACLVLFSARTWGAIGVSISFCAVVAFFMLPSATYIFFDRRKKWHADAPIDADIIRSEGM
jgi:O-antigen/teichoic acid export membrane protein